MQQEPSVAIYWDFENIHASVMNFEVGTDWFERLKDKKLRIENTDVLDVAGIMQYANTLGEVVINKAYANWTNFWPYSDVTNEYSMDLIQLFPLGKNAKNGADIRLSLDIAEDIQLHPHVDIVILVSGDSDFIAIAQRVRQKHKRIIGLGVKETSNRYWQMSCNEFKLYRTIVAQFGVKSNQEDDYEEVTSNNDKDRSASAKTPVKSIKPQTPMEQRLLRRAIGALESREGSPWIMRVKIKPMMLRLDPSFDEANHGHSNFTAFLEASTDVIELKETNSDVLVRVKPRTKVKAKPKAKAAPKRSAAPAPKRVAAPKRAATPRRKKQG
ncbi:MAG: NYN domain-containing protein [Saprospiraceae bacterium]